MDGKSQLVCPIVRDKFLLPEELRQLLVCACYFPYRKNLLATATLGEMQKAHPLGRKAASGFRKPIYNKLCLLLSSK